jgi:hypothetical protein
MSMRGEIISREYQSMVFVHDKDGKEYACYSKDLRSKDQNQELTAEERAKCTDLNVVLGDTW